MMRGGRPTSDRTKAHQGAGSRDCSIREAKLLSSYVDVAGDLLSPATVDGILPSDVDSRKHGFEIAADPHQPRFCTRSWLN
jgi:hypothetical protein